MRDVETVLTWTPSALQSPSSGLFSPPSGRWFHSSVWSWHLNSAEETSRLSRCVFQHLSAEAERCLIFVSTAEEMLLLSSYHCSSPPTLGVKVVVVVVGGSQPHLCLVEKLLVDGAEVFKLLPKLHQGILLLTDVLLQHLHGHLHLLLHPNLHLQLLLHILRRLIIETGTNYFGVF